MQTPQTSPLALIDPLLFGFRLLAAAVALFLSISVPVIRAQQDVMEGRPVLQVRVVDRSGNPVAEKMPSLPLEAGKPFDYSAERASMRVLYAMGDYSNIRTTAAPSEGGLRVDFVVTPNFYNNVIRIQGLRSPPSGPSAVAALRLNLGEPFRRSSLLEGVDRLQSALRDDGLYQAKITWAVAPHSDTRQMDVTFTVEQGPRARIDRIAVENKTPYADQQILARTKLSQKNELTSARLSNASEKLRKYLVGQGYLGAGVVITRGDYDPKTNRVPLKISATAGPRIHIDVTGAHISNGEQKKLLPMYEEGAVDEDLLQEGRRNLRDYLQKQGYFNADVQVHSDNDGKGGQVITYDATRGDKFRLVGIAFDGNKYFQTSLLSRRLQLQPAAFASSGRFSQQLLRADTDAIRAVYLSNGFRDVQISSAVDDRYNDKKNDLFVTFHIVEGMQTLVSDLQIAGNGAIDTKTLMNVAGSTPGEPYSESSVASDRNNILALYYNEGFPSASFHEETVPGDKPTEMRLIYHVTEGQRIDVAKVLLTGYEYTRPGIIRRQVEIKAEDPLRETDVANTQRQLYNLGVFDRVQIAPQNPEGSDPDKTVVVETLEGHRYTIGYGFGFEVQRISSTSNPSGTALAASPRGIFEIARANMFGRAQTLSFRARASTLEYRTALTYTADNFLTKHYLSAQLVGFAEKTQDINTFTSTRFEGGAQLVQRLSPGSSLLYRYFYRRVRASDIKVNPEEIPLLSEPTLVSGVGITYARDRRDNPGDASRGSFNTADASYASTTIGSSASFFRGFFQNSTYYSLGRSFVFARSVRFGVEVPTGNTVEGNAPFNPAQCTTTGPATDEEVIPLPERFYAGGGTTLRGFGLNQAGPRDPCTGFPVGGLGLLVFNQELHFPMHLPFVGNKLGGTILYDGGNVYSDVNHISLRWKAASLTDLNYFSHTVGFGFRYPTPIGPVRIDFGYQLNPAQYQVFNTTTQQTEAFRLSHFGFSFNIGPVF